MKITFTSIIAPSGSMTKVGAALLQWVCATAQTEEQHAILLLQNVLLRERR
jgi:hypothetical protein